MTLFMAIAVGGLFVVWIVTGVKMLVMASRTRSVPELLLGLALLLEAGVGYPMTALATFAGDFQVPLKMIGSAISDSGAVCLLLFTARVFREHDRRAWAFVGAMGALLGVHTVGYSRDLATVTTPDALR